MKEMTKQFLKDAFAGESQAHIKYQIFSEEAEKKGLKNLANLFKAISFAEYVHARAHFKALGLIGDVPANLQAAFDGETFEINEMYPVYHETAKFQNEKDAVRTTHYALEAEKIHADMYKKAKALAMEGKDYPAEKISICPVCGHTVEGEAPDKCPICGVAKDKFRSFEVK